MIRYLVTLMSANGNLIAREAKFSHLEDAEAIFSIWGDMYPAQTVILTDLETQRELERAA